MTSEERLRRGLEVARFSRTIAVVLQWIAAAVVAAGLVSAVLRFDSGAPMRWNLSLVLDTATNALGWGALVLIGSAGLRLWAARLELDIASRYDTSD